MPSRRPLRPEHIADWKRTEARRKSRRAFRCSSSAPMASFENAETFALCCCGRRRGKKADEALRQNSDAVANCVSARGRNQNKPISIMDKKPSRTLTRKRPSVWDRRRSKNASRLDVAVGGNGDTETLASKLLGVQTLLRAEESSRASEPAPRIMLERSALDCLAQLVEAIDRNDGVDPALAEARAILETAGLA